MMKIENIYFTAGVRLVVRSSPIHYLESKDAGIELDESTRLVWITPHGGPPFIVPIEHVTRLQPAPTPAPAPAPAPAKPKPAPAKPKPAPATAKPVKEEEPTAVR